MIGLFGSMFLGDDVLQLLLVPVLHDVVLLLRLLVQVDVPLGRLPLDCRVVRELTLVALLAEALLEEGTENRLGVDT